PAADGEQRRERPTRRAAAQVHGPRYELEQHEHEQRAAGERAGERRADVAVAHAERARLDEPDEPDDERAEGGPPHPVDVQPMAELLELILDRVRRPGDAGSDRPDDDA